eukprot:m.976384 g.976384  ORF g.976384 m.976384 type:complete len:134 (+) comp23945_c2_seq24:2015-2416(+)
MILALYMWKWLQDISSCCRSKSNRRRAAALATKAQMSSLASWNPDPPQIMKSYRRWAHVTTAPSLALPKWKTISLDVLVHLAHPGRVCREFPAEMPFTFVCACVWFVRASCTMSATARSRPKLATIFQYLDYL